MGHTSTGQNAPNIINNLFLNVFPAQPISYQSDKKKSAGLDKDFNGNESFLNIVDLWRKFA